MVTATILADRTVLSCPVQGRLRRILLLNDRSSKRDLLRVPGFISRFPWPNAEALPGFGNSSSDWPFMEHALMSTEALAGIKISRSPE